jgi:hypothetical protein
MMFADPLRLACPRCDATVYQRQLWSGNTLGARYYSDRKREAPMLPTFPSFSKCPKCGELFWVRDLKPTKDVDAPKYGPSESYLDMLDLEDTVRFLEEKNDTGDSELKVRTQLLQLYNDRVRYRVDQRTRAENEAVLWKSDADKERWQKNLERVGELTKEIAPDDATFSAEIARELGRFDEAVAILDAAGKTGDPEGDYEARVVAKIREKCAASDPFVFQCSTRQRSIL